MEELREVFDAKPSNIYELFVARGTTGFFIPAYQRDYAWDTKNLRRLFEDFSTGIKTYIEHDDAITFIGTVIAITDADSNAFHAEQKKNLPSQVMLLIDGQQRVTSFSLIAIALVEKLMTFRNIISDIQDEQLEREIRGLLDKEIEDLERLFSIDMNIRTGDSYRFYPKITRAYVDKWSTRNSEAEYFSPVAKFTHHFITHYFDKKNDEIYELFDYNLAGGFDGKEKVIVNFEEIKRLIDSSLNGDNEELIIPEIESMLKDENKDKFGFRRISLSKEEIYNLTDATKDLCLILGFIHFILHRVAVTSVVCKNESYAFDMFESLNTTGEPLTAFETFKPKVIDSVGIYEYQRSRMKSLIEKIEKNLNRYTKAEQRQAATSKILVPFRSAFDGDSLSKHLSEQRRFLNSAFEQMSLENDRNLFVESLSNMSKFVNICWQDTKSYDTSLFQKMFPFGNSSRELELFISVLRDANHTITQGVIFRFFQQYILDHKSQHAFNEMLDAVRAIVAFFIIWRSTNHGTSGIDNAYRTILKNEFNGTSAFSLKHGGFESGRTAKNLKERLKAQLLSKLKTDRLQVDHLVQRAHERPIYAINKTVTKFLLLLTAHQTAPCSSKPGLVIEANPGYHSAFSKDYWDMFRTIEHIFPQSARRGEWDDSLLIRANLEDSLGNLTILPSAVNSSLGNRSWTDKKLIYKVLSSVTPEQREYYLKEAKQLNVDIKDSTREILDESSFMGAVKSITKVDNWDADRVLERSQNLYSIAYSRLLRWLE